MLAINIKILYHKSITKKTNLRRPMKNPFFKRLDKNLFFVYNYNT